MTATRKFVLATFVLIGLFDLGSGLFMGVSQTPWILNGMADKFVPLLQQSSTAWADVLRGPYIRTAAFSVHVGVLTLFLTWRFRHDAHALSALFALYTIDGLGFAYYDHHYAAGTTYFYIKQVIGWIWVAALLSHAVEFWRMRHLRDTSVP